MSGEGLTMGQLREQLADCQSELNTAMSQLVGVEQQLREAGEPSVSIVSGLIQQLQGVFGQVECVLGDIQGLDGQEEVSAHADKLAKVTTLFQDLDGLKDQLS